MSSKSVGLLLDCSPEEGQGSLDQGLQEAVAANSQCLFPNGQTGEPESCLACKTEDFLSTSLQICRRSIFVDLCNGTAATTESPAVAAAVPSPDGPAP